MADPHAPEPFFAQPEAWVAIGFAIFVVATAKPLWKAITGALDGRAKRIARELDEAERLRHEAQALLTDYQSKHAAAVKEAEAIVARAQEDAERHAREGAARLEADLKRREQLAMQRIAEAERQAMNEVRGAAVDVALAATRALLERKLDDAGQARLVDAAIKELPGKLN